MGAPNVIYVCVICNVICVVWLQDANELYVVYWRISKWETYVCFLCQFHFSKINVNYWVSCNQLWLYIHVLNITLCICYAWICCVYVCVFKWVIREYWLGNVIGCMGWEECYCVVLLLLLFNTITTLIPFSAVEGDTSIHFTASLVCVVIWVEWL